MKNLCIPAHRIGGVLVLAVAFLLAAGCARQEPAAPDAAQAMSAPLPEGFKPAASILDLMLDPIDSSADFLWEAVATVSTTTGFEDHHPRTDEEWATVRRKALALMEGANLLVVEGRVVAHPGQMLSEPGGQGDFTPAQAQEAIDQDRASFVGFALALQTTTGQLLESIEKRDVDAYLIAGGAIDEACEGCHRKFWYPNSPLPPGL